MANQFGRSDDSTAMLPYWQDVEIFARGEDAVKECGQKYLPSFPKESREQYEFRLSTAKLTNIFSDVLDGLASKPFEEEIKFGGDAENVPQEVLDFSENVDGEGNNLTVFSGNVFSYGIRDAVSFILIDYPSDTGNIKTISDAKRENIKPYWSLILAKNVLDVKYKMIGAEKVIVLISILEQDGKKQSVRTFTRDGSVVKWVLEEYSTDNATISKTTEGLISIDVIPVVPFITGKRYGKGFRFVPPLQAAFSLQKTLYKQESALEHAKVMTAFPMLSASGVRPKLDENGEPVSIAVGPQAVLYVPPDGQGNIGQWSYIEPGAESLKFLADDIKETKQDLRELGKQPLTAQSGLTVITTAYAAGKSRSAVKAWGLLLKDSLENAFVITAKWLNLPEYDPEIAVYDDYDDIGSEDFTSVQEMRKNGDISRDTLWTEAKRRGILAPEFDAEEEPARLMKDRVVSEDSNFFDDETANDKEKPK